MKVMEYARKYADYSVEQRRYFHRHPEPSQEEFGTCRAIVKELEAMGLKPQVIHTSGVTVDIGDGSKSGKTVLLRADIDALRVPEETGEEFASENPGVSHACGHDGHIAMNLTAARILKDMDDAGELNGRVRLIFEPGEENARGANGMIAAGVLEGVDLAYGTHIWSSVESGYFGVTTGPVMASADFFTVTVKGRAVHGAEPQNGIDPIPAAAAIISELYTVFSREYSSSETVVLSICQMTGGNTDNAIPEIVTMGGTTRAFNEDIRQSFPGTIERVIKGVAAAHRAEAELDYRWGSPVVVNDAGAAEKARKAISANFGEDAVTDFRPIMVGDDYGEYIMRVPGVYVFLGIRNEECGAVWPQHSNHYRIDESALIKGAAAAVQYAVDFLNEEE
ncbi:MAG: amidohydrolase [Lachnospiraceae bacterium]|nr:amidohydrolase [Lachnospiraceae bacterium]